MWFGIYPVWRLYSYNIIVRTSLTSTNIKESKDDAVECGVATAGVSHNLDHISYEACCK